MQVHALFKLDPSVCLSFDMALPGMPRFRNWNFQHGVCIMRMACRWDLKRWTDTPRKRESLHFICLACASSQSVKILLTSLLSAELQHIFKTTTGFIHLTIHLYGHWLYNCSLTYRVKNGVYKACKKCSAANHDLLVQTFPIQIFKGLLSIHIFALLSSLRSYGIWSFKNWAH